MMRWWRTMNRIAIVIAAIFVTVYVIEGATAVAHNRIVVGENYWHAPLFAILQLIVFTVGGVALLWYAIRHWNDTAPPYDHDQ